jgi:hypothetical protein
MKSHYVGLVEVALRLQLAAVAVFLRVTLGLAAVAAE